LFNLLFGSSERGKKEEKEMNFSFGFLESRLGHSGSKLLSLYLSEFPFDIEGKNWKKGKGWQTTNAQQTRSTKKGEPEAKDSLVALGKQWKKGARTFEETEF
jgi:hypothetical protein